MKHIENIKGFESFCQVYGFNIDKEEIQLHYHFVSGYSQAVFVKNKEAGIILLDWEAKLCPWRCE